MYPDLSRNENAVLEYIATYNATYGISPSYREIGAAIGMASPSTIWYYIKSLEAKGYVRRLPAMSGGRATRNLVLTSKCQQSQTQYEALLHQVTQTKGAEDREAQLAALLADIQRQPAKTVDEWTKFLRRAVG